MQPDIDRYFKNAYRRLLDYAAYHCRTQNMAGEEEDLLMEVIADLLKKGEERLESLLAREKDGYSELDFLVLRMIRIYATSPTAPYRYKYKRGADQTGTGLPYETASWRKPEPTDEEIKDDLKKQAQADEIWRIIDELGTPERYKRIFAHKYLEGQSWRTWKGSESPDKCKEICKRIEKNVREKLNGELLF